MAITPGCYSDILEEDYHASEGVSVSKLKRHRKAAIFSTVPSTEETKTQKLGTLIHTVTLEPSSFDRRFIVNDLNRNSTEFKKIKAAADEERKSVIKQSEYDDARRIADGIHSDPEIRRMLEPGPDLLVEQSFYWVDAVTGLLCRGRADAIRLSWRAVIDLKSTADASPEAFAWACSDYLYDWQQAYYEEGINGSCGWEPDAFFFVAVEKKDPWIRKAYTIHPEDVAIAAEEVAEARAHYRQCAESGDWPAYGEDVGQIRIKRRTPALYLPPVARQPARLIAA